jgi:hypothetical protein
LSSNGDRIDRQTLINVTEVYLKNNYLKSFGYKKMKLSEAGKAGQRRRKSMLEVPPAGPK